MEFYRWTQESSDFDDSITQWYVDVNLVGIESWELTLAKRISDWNPETSADWDDPFGATDFPFTSDQIPIYSTKLRETLDFALFQDVQYLPIKFRNPIPKQSMSPYVVANYLKLIDCLDREASIYEIWTKETLLFWEQRPWMLGTFRDVRKPVLSKARIGDSRLFRLWGWSNMVVIREDLKKVLEDAQITGCLFTPLLTT